jgi:hypothetical protein
MAEKLSINNLNRGCCDEKTGMIFFVYITRFAARCQGYFLNGLGGDRYEAFSAGL